MSKRHFGKKLPIPSTVQIVRELLAFSAAEQVRRDALASGAPIQAQKVEAASTKAIAP